MIPPKNPTIDSAKFVFPKMSGILVFAISNVNEVVVLAKSENHYLDSQNENVSKIRYEANVPQWSDSKCKYLVGFSGNQECLWLLPLGTYISC